MYDHTTIVLDLGNGETNEIRVNRPYEWVEKV